MRFLSDFPCAPWQAQLSLGSLNSPPSNLCLAKYSIPFLLPFHMYIRWWCYTIFSFFLFIMFVHAITHKTKERGTCFSPSSKQGNTPQFNIFDMMLRRRRSLLHYTVVVQVFKLSIDFKCFLLLMMMTIITNSTFFCWVRGGGERERERKDFRASVKVDLSIYWRHWMAKALGEGGMDQRFKREKITFLYMYDLFCIYA